MKFRRPSLLALAALLLFSLPAFSQGFGRNRLLVRDYPYKMWETEHFYIYYYEENPLLLEETAKYLEAAYNDLVPRIEANINKKLPFFLYTTHNEFEQTRIVDIGEGTGGVTESFKDRFLVFNDGSMAWLRHVIYHEFTHEVQFAILNAGFWKSARLLKSILYPLWLIEGQSEYFSGRVDETTDLMYARDGATSKTAPFFPLRELHNFNHLKPNQVTRGYKQGSLAVDYIAQEYGEDKLGLILKSFWERFDINAVLLDVLNIDFDRFDKNFREWAVEVYAEQAKGLDEPSRYAAKLTKPEKPIPVFRYSPVISKGGEYLYYISMRQGFPAVYQQSLITGKRKILAGREYFKLDWIALEGRNLSLTRDGRYLYFTGEKNLIDHLYRYDLQKKKLESRRIKNLDAIQSPQGHPFDSNRVVLSGMDNGFTDIYTVDFNRGEIVHRLTSDSQSDSDPVYLPDGSGVIYSTEVGISSEGISNRDLALWSDGQIQRITHGARVETAPSVSADGKKILFTSDQSGVFDLYEMDLTSGKVWRRTRVISGIFSPSYASDGQIVYSSFRDGEIDIYKGAAFLDEEVTGQFKGAPVFKSERLPEVSMVARGPYRPQFGTDLFFPAFFFSTQGGLFALAYWQASDLLGYHNLGTSLALNTGDKAIDYSVDYFITKYRTDFAFIFRGTQFEDPSILSDQGENLRKQEHLQAFLASYPFDRFHRIEGIVGVTERYQRFSKDPVALTNLQELGLTGRFVRDTTTAPFLVVTRGSRFELGAKRAPTVAEFDLEYWTHFAEWHQFIPIAKDSTIASRLAYQRSYGLNNQVFPVAGRTGVRGYPQERDENMSSGVLVNNVEIRFPLIPNMNYHMWYMFPDFYFKNIYLGLFSDQGIRWNGHFSDLTKNWEARRKDDLLHSVGVSLKFNTFILQTFPFFFSFDWAKRTKSSGVVMYGSVFQYFAFGSNEKTDKTR